VIHLPNSPNRYDNIKEFEKKLNKNISIVEAISGKNEEKCKNMINEMQIDFNGGELFSIGEVGCYLSHMKIIRDVLIEDDYNYGVVFEDDFSFEDENLHEKIEEALHNILLHDKDFDILYLGNLNDNRYDNVKNNIYTVDKNNPLWGTHAYLINNKKKKKIFNSLKKFDKAIDNKLKELIDLDVLKGYVLYPSIVFQQSQNGKLPSVIR
jgi:GR25 family glycosyltransferase involved in LPS biosynthesis